MRSLDKQDKKTQKTMKISGPVPTDTLRSPSSADITSAPVIRAENSALHSSVKIGNKDVIRTLLPTSSINARDSQGQTPLHVAAFEGNVEVLALLCEESIKLKMNIDFSIFISEHNETLT